jgi:hypothetical protein
MQSASDMSRAAGAFVPVCAATAKAAVKKIETIPKIFMMRDFAASAAIRQMQDAAAPGKVTN